MIKQKIKVLIIEDNPADAELIVEMLGQAAPRVMEVDSATTMVAGLDMIAGNQYHAVLLDLGLPDSKGLDSVTAVETRFPYMPIIVITGLDDEQTGLDAVKLGAQDYVIKGKMNGWDLNYSVRYSIERKKIDEAIIRSKILLQNVLDSTPDWIYVKDQNHRFLLANKSFAEAQRLIPQEMIGKPDSDFFTPELCFGDPGKGITGFHKDDDEAFRGRIVRNPKNVISWADGTAHIYDTVKMPLIDGAETIYAVLVYSRDITERQKAEEELHRSYERVNKTLEDIIDTIGIIVDMRDPYTAGHQRRTAQLAVAIAKELNLTDQQTECINKASKIHDVGKIYVPSDLLSKPGKLTEVEWLMIQTHAQGSYNVLKNIEFGMPIALIALQHHEKLDGSGYPNKLTEKDILLESKIVALADVVEAMASHRPYRPAHSIDETLKEIRQNRGILYDPDAVDACITLFQEKGFTLI